MDTELTTNNASSVPVTTSSGECRNPMMINSRLTDNQEIV